MRLPVEKQELAEEIQVVRIRIGKMEDENHGQNEKEKQTANHIGSPCCTYVYRGVQV